MRVPSDLEAKVRELAELNDRSVSREIERALRAHVESHPLPEGLAAAA